MTPDFFSQDLFSQDVRPWREDLCPGALVLRHFVQPRETALLAALDDISGAAPLRHLVTRGGFRMSVAMTNCGDHGWWSDHSGYSYTRVDPLTGKPWPSMPEVFRELAKNAAASAGFPGFEPDACLINRYAPGARLSLHQDRNERDFSQPIVSVSLGLPAVFLFGGLKRTDKSQRIALTHGDVVVWGSEARLRFHGVAPLKPGIHPQLGECRINLTFRKAA
jgi:alkylated DNA repair protein (DNA oxidative demethylase)